MSDHAKQQAEAQYESICEMVAALNCDYDRLQEVRDEIEALREERDEIVAAQAEWLEENPPRLLASGHHPGDNGKWAMNVPDENDRLGENEEELKELEDELVSLLAEAGECESTDEARERIQEDPLEVQVRGDWHAPGDEDAKPEEFYVLLCTGGPAVRIRGELGYYCEPIRAWIEYQDWGTPWTQYFDADQDILLAYCCELWFGE